MYKVGNICNKSLQGCLDIVDGYYRIYERSAEVVVIDMWEIRYYGLHLFLQAHTNLYIAEILHTDVI